MVGQLTGGNPKTTGVYYDVTYNHALIDPTASPDAVPDPSVCAHPTLGANVPFDESIDRDKSRLDAGQGLPNLPSGILDLTSSPGSLIDPAALPIDPATCQRVYPHSYLKVNTVFEVAKAHGLRTAWSDKHPAYEILNGPSGAGLDDLFTPEINSLADAAGHDWTGGQLADPAVRPLQDPGRAQRDQGLRPLRAPSGRHPSGLRAELSVGVHRGEAPGLRRGHGRVRRDRDRARPVLAASLGFVDHEIGELIAGLRRADIFHDTALILSAKHGQSPKDGSALKRIDDGAVIDALNAAWQDEHADQPQPLVAASLNDDGMLLWFSNGDRTRLADAFATRFLRSYDGDGTSSDGQAKATDIAAAPVPYTSAGLDAIHAGADAAAFIGTTTADPRVPDLIGVVQHGVVYTGKTAKIAEHGGDDPQDRHVPLVVSGPGHQPRSAHRSSRDHPDRPNHPGAARHRPKIPASSAHRAHGGPAGHPGLAGPPDESGRPPRSARLAHASRDQRRRSLGGSWLAAQRWTSAQRARWTAAADRTARLPRIGRRTARGPEPHGVRGVGRPHHARSVSMSRST